jgi:RNA-directed DNA polymerase
VNNKFSQIIAKAKACKKMKFTSLAHHINKDLLMSEFCELKRNKASGIDKVTVGEYEARLGSNIESLIEKMKSKTYRPKPVRRAYIPKPGKDEKRGLGIPSTEDKLVQLGVKRVLESIFETDFLDCSHGFRPNRSCHTAIKALNKAMMTEPVQYVVEVDIKGFFDNVNHYWLQRCLEERISDPNFLWIIRRLLKAGIMEGGKWLSSEKGAPQGGVASPLLANIYLHYVLDLWFEKKFRNSSRNYMGLIRYCDDFIALFATRKDAERFLIELKERLAKFKLSVAEDKTRLIEFGKRVYERHQRSGTKASTFSFLGFTHYYGKSRKGKIVAGHKTAKENLRRKLRLAKDWLRKMRAKASLKGVMHLLKAKLLGHYNYFGISGNYRCIKQFYDRVLFLVFKWMNRRSERKSMDWPTFVNCLRFNPLPAPRITINFYTPG